MRIENEGVSAREAYRTLITHETRNNDPQADQIRVLPRSAYIDVVSAMQEAAAIAPTAAGILSRSLSGLLFLQEGSSVIPLLVREGRVWVFDSIKRAGQWGWGYGDDQ